MANAPEDITCSEQVFDIDFHPNGNFVAAGLIDGSVELWQYGTNGGTNQAVMSVKNHASSCRGVLFSDFGDKLYSISSDKSLRTIDGSGNQILCRSNAHDSAINRLIKLSEDVLVTGDDSGVVKLWDLRTVGGDAAPAMEWHVHQDFIAGLTYSAERETIVSISGDSSLCAYDIRSENVYLQSEQQESELSCVQIVRGGAQILCGTQDGVMLLFSWDDWGDCSDRFPGHPETVDSMWKIDESTVITGSSDGFLRVVSLHPNKILGVIGDHEEFPVEGMCASRDGRVLGSFAHDEVIRFWDISEIDSHDYSNSVTDTSSFTAGFI